MGTSFKSFVQSIIMCWMCGSVEEYKKFIEAAINIPFGTEAIELCWYMLEIFTEHDLEKTGFVKLETFPSMMDKFLVTPDKHGLTVPSTMKPCSKNMTQEMMEG